MYTNLKKIKYLFLMVIVSSCSLFSEDNVDILKDFSITPTNYYGKSLTGLVKFRYNVETPVWYSASGMLKFDGVSTADSIMNDSVSIYYTDVPYVLKTIKDSLGVDSTVKSLRTKDTVSIRFYHNNTEYISTKVITLKNFKPVIDFFQVTNGNYMEFGNRRVASFLIGSGTGKIKCFSDNFKDDSVSIYWHSNSDLIADRKLMSYLPFEFDIPETENNVMIYVDVINKNGAIKKDSLNITVYKERGSIWVLDESKKIFKFSSLGGAIAVIDSVYASDLIFLENSNSVIVQSSDSLNRYYTTGDKLDFSIKKDSSGVRKLYKFDNDLYISSYNGILSILKKYTDYGDFVSTKINYSGKLQNYQKYKDKYVFSETRNDSCFLHILISDSIVHTENNFLRIKQLEKYDGKGYIIALDDILGKVTVFNLLTNTVVGNITGFRGKPVAMSVNNISGILYIIDGSSSLISINLLTMSGDINISSVAPTSVEFDLPKFIAVNEYADTDGAGSIWICDTHNDRVVKLNSSGSPLVYINGYFHLPQKLVINKGL